MSKPSAEQLEQFLKELSAVTRRHKIGIAGCGCCGSPFLYLDKEIRGGSYQTDGVQRLVFVSKKRKPK